MCSDASENPDSRIEAFVVAPADEGQRLDVFCVSRLGEVSRSQIQKLIKSGRVLVDSRSRPASHPLKGGETVRVDLPHAAAPAREIEAEDIPVTVAFEDDDIVVVNKAAGLVVHPASGNRDGTLVNALLGRGIALSAIGGEDRPGVVHRLDKDTSGLIVLAKTDRAYGGLTRQIAARSVDKMYHAIVWGALGVASTRIDAPIARHPVHRQRMAVARSGGREAFTEVFVVDTFRHFDYIRVITVTGRTHQIRVHLSSISHPILGDPVYGGRRVRESSPSARTRARMNAILEVMRRQALHASRIGFDHPVSGRRLEFRSALPADMRSVLEILYREEKS
jgi:23S rRNA pseudouridine1911/1915/1917 synthase